MNSEARLISAVCETKDIAPVLAADIDGMMFTHSDVWGFVKDYYFKYQSVPDIETVTEKMGDFEPTKVKESDITFYIDEVKNDYINAEIATLVENVAKHHGKVAGKQLVGTLLKKVSVLARETDVIRDLDLTDFDAAAQYFERKRERAIANDGAVGIRTGFEVMDAMYPTGLAPGHLGVIIGWSGHGKSWFATLMACRAWAAGYKPMIVSLEMSPEEVRDRAYTIMGAGEFRHSDFARGMINVDGFTRWAGTAKPADARDFIVVSSEGAGRVTPSTVQLKIDQHRPDLVILDYQQLFDSDEQEGNETVRNRKISREFKRMAVRNNIAVLNLTQATFNDPKDTEIPPRIEQVAWSKGIQQDADLALAVHKYEDSNAWAIIAEKNRHGEEFNFGLDWSVNDGTLTEIV